MPKTAPARLVLGLSLLAGFVLRVRFTDDGVFWPDEIYQSLEPAHWLVFGYGLLPWEFVGGARNWAFPGLVALLMKLGASFGGDRPTTYIPFVKLVFSLASTAAGYGVYQLVIVGLHETRVRMGELKSELAAACAAALWSLCVAALYFAPRAMSENASAAAVVFGLALTLNHDSTVHRAEEPDRGHRAQDRG